MKSTETHVHGGAVSKVERYNWSDPGAKGTFAEMSPHAIQVDRAYQRPENEDKIKDIARNFNWRAFGVAPVSVRPSGEHFAMDAQHRILAARRRSDVVMVPVLIFATETAKEEACSFLQINTGRKPLTARDTFRAKMTSGSEAAALVDRLIRESGRSISEASSSTSVACLALLVRLAESDQDLLLKIWPLVVEVADGAPLHNRVVETIAFIESRATNGSLLEAKWKARLLALGVHGIVDAAAKAAAFYASGGQKVWSRGVLNAINKGMRNKLTVRGLADDETP